MWIQTIAPEKAEGKLRVVYEEIRGTRGKIANIFLAQGLNAAALKAHLDLYLAIMYGSSKLNRSQREVIATVVSVRNHCDYCVAHHSEALTRLVKDSAVAESLKQDMNSAKLDEKNRKMLTFSVKLTERPNDMEEEDLRRLRDAGFSDSEILDTVLVASYFNFVNRIALALGVEFGPDEMEGYKY